jgi:hypothetical protein
MNLFDSCLSQGCSESCCLRRWHASFMLESLFGNAIFPGHWRPLYMSRRPLLYVGTVLRSEAPDLLQSGGVLGFCRTLCA